MLAASRVCLELFVSLIVYKCHLTCLGLQVKNVPLLT